MSSSDFECCLCGLNIDANGVYDGDDFFCCHGCQAVFRILSVKNQLENFASHPIFLQAMNSGLISNPKLLESIQRNQLSLNDQEMERLQIEIQDMWCPSCAQVIKLLLCQERGIRNCVVDYATDLALIEYAPKYISKENIFKLIQKMGYTPVSLEDASKNIGKFNLYLRLAIAAFFALNVMMFAYPLYSTYFNDDEEGMGSLFAWLSLGASLPVVTYCAWPIYKRFLNSLKLGLFGMETLVVMGVFSAFALSVFELFHGSNRVYFDSMTVIIAFMLLGKIIESKAKYSAKEALYRLNKALPKRARKRFSDGKQDFIALKEVELKDILVVLTGEKIVLDGIVIEGEGSCDESLITGEAFPVSKQKDSALIAGTVLTQGWLAYKVTSKEESSTLKQIISLVEHEVGHKSQYTRAADKVVLWFVPVVMTIAVCAGLYAYFGSSSDHSQRIQEGVIRAISVLLISCPCAIGIAAPLAESNLLNALAKQGVIVRNRGCLKDLGNETVFVFDKTGTVTKGKLSVIEGVESLPTSIKAILKTLSSYSTHPVSIAIAQYIDIEGINLEKVEEHSGKGMKGYLNGEEYYLGSELFLCEMGYKAFQNEFFNFEDLIVTTVYLGLPSMKVIPIRLTDLIKKEIKPLLELLQPTKSILLSGDSERSVKAVAAACKFKEYYWHMNPLQKQEFVSALKGKQEVVCMIGDGVNDAPALSAAQVGISVLMATDISIQVSDIFLTIDKLSVLPNLRYLSIKAKRIVSQNLFWAFIYNVIGIGLAFFGVLSPIFAAFAMILSSLFVIINAQRLSE